MRPPTDNSITTEKHGTYHAVDYASAPDVYVYAPEDMTWIGYYLNAGNAGNNLQMDGEHGTHGFCHLEEIYIVSGQSVTKGQKIAKMGYTGLCEPPGPGGRHLHWVIRQGGKYVYPPSLITESFNKGEAMSRSSLTREEIMETHQLAFQGENAPEDVINAFGGKTLQELLQYIHQGGAWKNRVAEIQVLRDSVKVDKPLLKDLVALTKKYGG
jgi:murein DD-endopeptidase MepM/ murein hydrolase activator NlpD